jgi:hypothetical protein
LEKDYYVFFCPQSLLMGSCFYSVFQGFSKAKSANGGSILSLRQFSILPQLAQKNEARFKSGQR